MGKADGEAFLDFSEKEVVRCERCEMYDFFFDVGTGETVRRWSCWMSGLCLDWFFLPSTRAC